MIKLRELTKLDLRVATVVTCEEIPKSRNFFRFELDCGREGARQIISNLPAEYSPEKLVNSKVVALLNAEPRRIMGELSEGLLLAADVGNQPYILKLDQDIASQIPSGTKIR
ncbi:MAG: hypothetical protein ACOC4M_07085 [Promethearchaeia archaeon]